MHMSNESLLIILGVGLIQGPAKSCKAPDLGSSAISSLKSLARSSVVGCFLNSASILARALLRAIINATIGALILLLLISFKHQGQRQHPPR